LADGRASAHARLELRERIMRGVSAEAYPDAGAIAELIAACREVQVAMQLEAA
jgi:hypothetical protein